MNTQNIKRREILPLLYLMARYVHGEIKPIFNIKQKIEKDVNGNSFCAKLIQKNYKKWYDCIVISKSSIGFWFNDKTKSTRLISIPFGNNTTTTTN